jgi:hypothetical protein
VPCKGFEEKSLVNRNFREEILDVWACDQWKKEHYFQYHNRYKLWNLLGGTPIRIKIAEESALKRMDE